MSSRPVEPEIEPPETDASDPTEDGRVDAEAVIEAEAIEIEALAREQAEDLSLIHI